MTERVFSEAQMDDIVRSTVKHLLGATAHLPNDEQFRIVDRVQAGVKKDLALPVNPVGLKFVKLVIDRLAFLIEQNKKIEAIKELRALLLWMFHGKIHVLPTHVRRIITESDHTYLGGIANNREPK